MTTTAATTSRAAEYDEIVRVVQLHIGGLGAGSAILSRERSRNDASTFTTKQTAPS